MSSGFVHLHNHTEFSLLDGAGSVKKMVAMAKELDMPAIAITDHGAMYGIIDFYKACKSEGVKPVIGCEFYVAPRSRYDKKSGKDDYQYHLVLLAKNMTGYRNLMQLVTKAYCDGFYYKPRVDREILEEYSEGLIALSACIAGEIPYLILQGREKEAKETALYYNNVYGQGNFYLEIQDHGLVEQKKTNEFIIKLSSETGIPLVATNDTHYIKKDDAEAHDVLLCIQTGKTVEDEKRMKFSTQEFYLKSRQEMEKLFPDNLEALDNALVIAEQCDIEFDFNTTYLPLYDIPEEHTEASYLRELCLQGLKQKYESITPQIMERLDYELGVIKKMGYDSYFLIVWDFIRYALDNNILVGPGRGSAAGSLVAYALSITNIDPLEYSLLFERFLNPERVTMPDIDIDFCYENREKVINYVVDKYGTEKVAQIITFGTMAAKAAVRDVGRALNFSFAETDKIAKLIPPDIGMTIEKAMEQSSELKELVEKDQKLNKLIEISRKVEGLSRHASTHAAGVVISQEPLVTHVPLQKTNDDAMVTQFPMGTLEELGLLKMDFLGLRTLTIMGETVDNIRQNQRKEVDFNNIPLDDKKTFELLSQGDSIGIFQLESSGMRNVLKELRPSKFEEIIAVVALYRPGPMEQIPTFVKSKHGEIPIEYPHKDLESILKETYGIMVYQEQIMQVASKMAGFSLGQADLLRRAIGKKKKDVLDQQREVFVKGCVENKYDKKLGNKLYDLIVKFASYGFNKSHAAAYAMIAYQTAYLKANYPVEFMAAMLTGAMSSGDKIPLYINDCKKRKIDVLPPDINESMINFTPIGEGKIRFGLAAVKNVGHNAILSILKARKEAGPFVSLKDFCSRVDIRQCNRKVIESLIKSGAFDSTKGYRSQLLSILEGTISAAQIEQREKENGQISMFEMFSEEDTPRYHSIEDELPDIPEVSSKDKLAMEKEVLGLYISGHPLDFYVDILNNLPSYTPVNNLSKCREQQKVTIIGMISSFKKYTTKNGKEMAFLSLEDLGGTVEAIVFPDIFAENRNAINTESVVIIKGKISSRDEEDKKVICERITSFPNDPQQVFLKINQAQEELDILFRLRQVLEEEKGNIPVYLYFKQYKKMILTEEKYWINESMNIVPKIESLLGKGNVTFKKIS